MIYRSDSRRVFFSPDGGAIRGGNAGADANMRQNLRVPMHLETFLYPLNNSWVGRRRVTVYDLSCGGIAFFSDIPYQIGETLEILIPVTSKPLLVQGSILRQEPFAEGRTLYAAKFINLCEGEEALIREAVFSAQIKQSRQR